MLIGYTTFFRSFYVDPERPFGVNNEVFFQIVGMPWVLEELQGYTAVKHGNVAWSNGEMKDVYVGIKSDGNGKLSPEEFDQAMLDLTNFLVYMGEPMQLERKRLGYFVTLFFPYCGPLAYLD